jgi:hypothetical protein
MGLNSCRLGRRANKCQTGTTAEFRPLWDLIEAVFYVQEAQSVFPS